MYLRSNLPSSPPADIAHGLVQELPGPVGADALHMLLGSVMSVEA